MTDQWQSIETAPLDGTWVIITGGEPGSGWDHVQAENTPPMVIAQFLPNDHPHYAPGHWQFAWYDGGYYGEWDDPTHWQPLPAQREQAA